MAIGEFSMAFGLGLAGSVHCVGMCGPLVLAYSMPMAAAHSSKRRLLFAHLSYNAGRLTTYSVLGALAGAAGGAVGLLGRVAGIANLAAIFAGCAMLLAGLWMSGLIPARTLVVVDRLGVSRFFSRTVGRLITSPGVAGKFGLGLTLGFLPCGLLYAALLKSIETASPVSGALTMLAFGLGTASALLAIGAFSSALTAKLGRWGNTLAAISVMLMGTYLLWRGAMVHPRP